MSEVGIEKSLKAMDLASDIVSVGIKVGKGGVDITDLQYAEEAFGAVKALVVFVAEKPEIVAEIKNLNAMEGFALLQKAYGEYLEVKEETK